MGEAFALLAPRKRSRWRPRASGRAVRPGHRPARLLGGHPPDEFPTPLFDLVANRITLRGAFGGTRRGMELSVAPALRRTWIAGLLGVMANRLARIIDRAREAGSRKGSLRATAIGRARGELTSFESRRLLASGAINVCTGAALLVRTVIVTLSIKAFLGAHPQWVAGSPFSAALLAVIGGLSCSQAEVSIALHTSSMEIPAFGI